MSFQKDVLNNKYLSLELTKNMDDEELDTLNEIAPHTVNRHYIYNEANGNIHNYIKRLKNMHKKATIMFNNLEDYYIPGHRMCVSCGETDPKVKNDGLMCKICKIYYCNKCKESVSNNWCYKCLYK